MERVRVNYMYRYSPAIDSRLVPDPVFGLNV